MQASDIILGLLIIMLTGWSVMLAVQQHGLSVGLQALESKQVAQGIQISPEKCAYLPGKALVKAPNLAEAEYFTTYGFDLDQNQAYVCFYE